MAAPELAGTPVLILREGSSRSEGREAGCREASDLCTEATEAVVKDEKRHLELCEQSCTLCHEGRFPAEPRAERAPCVT